MEKIMIVEDEPKLAAMLADHLDKNGFVPIVIQQFDHVMDTFRTEQPHLVLLDINLPRYDGFYWCRQIRTLSTCPVLFISARDGEMDQVRALENGGDDYITKPFHYEIVMAKIRSHLRRAYGEYAVQQQERICELAGLSLYVERPELKLNEQMAIALTRKEADILELLITKSPRTVSREQLLDKIWDARHFVDENTLNVNMTRVRKRLQELGVHDAVETVRGSGYRLLPNWQTDVESPI